MSVRIFQPAKSAMQSGRGKQDGRWLLEHEPSSARRIEPLMGWTASDDTRTQLKIWFDSKEEAIAYAEAKRLPYTVSEPKTRKVKPKAYADNFAHDRLLRWTH